MKLLSSLSIIIVIFLISCGVKKENEILQMENEELQAELNRAQMAVSTLEEVGSLIDSIDKARNALKLELEAGIDYDDYLSRMQDINDYVSNTEAKVTDLENELNKSSSKNQSYVRTISRLRKDLASKTKEISNLKASVEKYKKENTSLLNMMDLQEAEMFDMEEQITMKMEELELIENRILEVMKKSQMTEADSYFALGEALEEAARRTKLAPKKRKETYKEAIEIYKKSLAFGREDAQGKIDELEKKI
jgi:chromosome segregation ATPase